MRNWEKTDIIALISLLITILSWLTSVQIEKFTGLNTFLKMGWFPILSLVSSGLLLIICSFIYWKKTTSKIQNRSGSTESKFAYSKQARFLALFGFPTAFIISVFGLIFWPYYLKNHANELILSGEQYMSKKQYDRAISSFDQAISLQAGDSVSALAFQDRGESYYQKQDYFQALNDYNKAIVLQPQIAENYYLRGTISLEKDDFKAAVTDYSQAISLNPNFAVAYYGRGLAYSLIPYSENNAKADFQKVLSISKNVELRQEAEKRLKQFHRR